MASMHKDKRTGKWLILFRWNGKQYCKSAETRSKAEARAIEGRVEDTIRLLKRGRIEVPQDADPGVWIMSDGKAKQRPRKSSSSKSVRKFSDVCDAYLQDQHDKAETTISGERKHIGHLKALLGAGRELQQITLSELQDYVNRRAKQSYQGRRISGPTIRKELVTFRQIWAWAREREVVSKDCPIYDVNHRWSVRIQKPREKERFQTWALISRQIARGSVDKDRKRELWQSLFLDEDQVADLLAHAAENCKHDFIHPMFVFAAYTGARRGEIRRSEIDDFDFETGQVKLRERKRRKNMAETFRFVPMHARLSDTMREWFKKHPGGPYTITAPLRMARRPTRDAFREMTPDECHHHFKQTLKGSKWEVIRGFHVLRHSFGSNLARSGKVPRDTIAKWMGHTTEEMKDLYQHLFPQDGQSQIEVLK